DCQSGSLLVVVMSIGVAAFAPGSTGHHPDTLHTPASGTVNRKTTASSSPAPASASAQRYRVPYEFRGNGPIFSRSARHPALRESRPSSCQAPLAGSAVPTVSTTVRSGLAAAVTPSHLTSAM